MRLEWQLGGRVAGLDEVGRGSWAGPVVAAAVVLNPGQLSAQLLADLDDSKKLKPLQRKNLFVALADCADIGIGEASVTEIDSLNILKATFLAMARAMETLKAVNCAIVDGNQTPPLLGCSVTSLVKGDGISASVAAASIIAKVTRDRLMACLATEHPGYGWETNMGYGTPAHRIAIARLGLTPYHRHSFAPIVAYLQMEIEKTYKTSRKIES